MLAVLGLTLPTASVVARRMQDTNHRGEFSAALYIGWPTVVSITHINLSSLPSAIQMLIGIVFLVGLIWSVFWWCCRGTKGPNRFGEDPLRAVDGTINPSSSIMSALSTSPAETGPADATTSSRSPQLWSSFLEEIRSDEAEKVAIQRGIRSLPFHLASAATTLFGGALVAVSMFMPSLTLNGYVLQDDMMIEKHPVFLLCTVAAIVSVARFRNVGSKASAHVAVGTGVLFAVIAVFDTYTPLLWWSTGTQVSAGSGLWTAGVGALIVALGGLMMRFPQRSFGLIGSVMDLGENPIAYQTKNCPRCAETIKAAASICRYCQYQFPAGAEAQE